LGIFSMSATTASAACSSFASARARACLTWSASAFASGEFFTFSGVSLSESRHSSHESARWIRLSLFSPAGPWTVSRERRRRRLLLPAFALLQDSFPVFGLALHVLFALVRQCDRIELLGHLRLPGRAST
jgi:hypothetical protein